MSAEWEIGFLPLPLKRSCKPLQIELGYKYLCTMYQPIRVEFCLQSTCRIDIFQSTTRLSSGVRCDNSSLIMAEFEAAAKLNEDSSKARGRSVFFFSLSCNHSPSHGSMLLYVVSTEFFLFFFVFFMECQAQSDCSFRP